MIEVEHLGKRYGSTQVVDDLTFEVRPGEVTGFLGPNGSGKSTTMRMILGLDEPTSGRALVNGRPYESLDWPLREVGACVDGQSFHPGRSPRAHLRALAAANAIAPARVDLVLDQVGLTPVAHRRAGKFSLGMGQRLGIAAAMLGDPGVLVLDEPINGLDPQGIRWIRDQVRLWAGEGRTVLVSSHLITEMALSADRLIIIGRGRMLDQLPMSALPSGTSLEDFYLSLTNDSVEYHAWSNS